MNRPVRIPQHWSGQQALAALDLLELFYEAIWDTYQEPLVKILGQQAQAQCIPEPPERFDYEDDLDDDIPF